jgi:hypothetical protein
MDTSMPLRKSQLALSVLLILILPADLAQAVSQVESGTSEGFPDYYDWYGPGPEEQTQTASIRLGETSDTKTYPQIPTSLSAPTFQPVTTGRHWYGC